MPDLKRLSVLLLLSVCANLAFAHEGAGVVSGFSSGFLHPLLGWDHVAAMVAVGLWGAFLGPARHLRAAGGVPAGDGGSAACSACSACRCPAVEAGIALSALVLGADGGAGRAAAADGWRALLVAAFAVFHGSCPWHRAARERADALAYSASVSSSPPGCCIWPASPSAC
jgi:urease accessory protein